MAGMFRRDYKIFFRYPMNAIFRIVEPVAWLTPIYFMGKGFAINGENVGFAAYTGNGDYMAFIILGVILSSYVSAVLWGIGYSLKQQMDIGVLESNWLTPIPRITHLIGQTLFNVLITTLNSIGVALIIWLLFGFELNFEKILLAILTALPMIIAIYGFGFGFAALVMLMRDANTLVDTGNFIINLLSGANFPITVLPRFLLVVSLSIPLTYGYDAIRGMLLGTRTVLPIHQEQMILVVFMGAMVVLGVLVFKWLERRCKKLGTIGMH
ncbi:hypothetical protein BBF96_15440 [Anoxybacter fermentans]|uniref:Transport permease protein n=2 Tax=Anoxybacter fermentans TaxID=1323375 RepID=A0A3S9T377_9FIRM|nr:hypothetical protein BBF96_15440 [Anoxybacter fermentans]